MVAAPRPFRTDSSIASIHDIERTRLGDIRRRVAWPKILLEDVTKLGHNAYGSRRHVGAAFFSTANSTSFNDRGATLGGSSLRRSPLSPTGRICPSRQTTTFADGAWRESFLRVKSVLASLTSSKKQTHIISVSSASTAVPAPAVRAMIPSRLKVSARTIAAQSSEPAEARNAEH
jgi:hypothetical protein